MNVFNIHVYTLLFFIIIVIMIIYFIIFKLYINIKELKKVNLV